MSIVVIMWDMDFRKRWRVFLIGRTPSTWTWGGAGLVCSWNSQKNEGIMVITEWGGSGGRWGHRLVYAF